MILCPACDKKNLEGSSFCAFCGATLRPSLAATGPLGAAAQSQAGKSPSSKLGDSRSTTDRRFLPGTILANRYRIFGQIGRGGMGEVYRADDLKLGQPVALKFLPQELAKDGVRMARLLSEVSVARQVSHPNVCRVYDIGEIDDEHFFSMEYIDGEDLASLLRRIGRLPKEKATDIARQLCAGLAAAHDSGVLHRDLKPSNIMIDGRGRARITDFGLAGVSDTVTERQVGAGTPAYMAPEQFSGTKATVKSDLYALGLVLYELFTGKRPFEAATIRDIARLQEESNPVSPARIVEDLDKAIERVILNCLRKDPENRPGSALAVAAALPGGDPLAAALAAGETPSPEMVAAAGKTGALSPSVAWSIFGAAIGGLALVALLSGKTMLYSRMPLAKPPEVLVDRAKELIQKFGYDNSTSGSFYTVKWNELQLRYVAAHDAALNRWDTAANRYPSPVLFFYRQSPRPLVPYNELGRILWDRDPPQTISGMKSILLDSRGRLLAFHAVPPQLDTSPGPWSEYDWARMFSEAGLKVESFHAVAPTWASSSDSDQKKAWEGNFPDLPTILARVSAASYHGKPVDFEVRGPWDQPFRMSPIQTSTAAKARDITFLIIFISAAIGGGLLARRNMRLGRGDHAGAFRIAAYGFSLAVLSWVFAADHVASLPDEWDLLVRALGFALFWSAFFWLVYMALEPDVRRRWPNSLISWNRLLAGRFRDPLVGRDILFGGCGGIAGVLLLQIRILAPTWFGKPALMPNVEEGSGLISFGGMRYMAHAFFASQFVALLFGLLFLFTLFILHFLFRRKWLAFCALLLLVAIVDIGRTSEVTYLTVLFGAMSAALLILAFNAFGFLVVCVWFFFGVSLTNYAITVDASAWYFGRSAIALLMSALIVFYGFRTALAVRPLFQR